MKIEQQLPDGVRLSPDLCERARFFIVVQAYGVSYRVAATAEVCKLLGLDCNGVRQKMRVIRTDSEIERALRDILNSLHLQLRDCVFAGIESNVTSELLEQMRRAMSPTVQKLIQQAAEPRLLNEPGEITEA